MTIPLTSTGNKMKFKLEIKPNTQDEEKDTYNLRIETYNGKIQGRFEKSEIREMIELLDNGIHH